MQWRSAVCLLLLNAQLAYTGRNSPADNVAVPSAEPSGTPDCASWCSIDFAAQHCEGAGAHRACDLCDYCIARAEQREYEMLRRSKTDVVPTRIPSDPTELDDEQDDESVSDDVQDQ